MNNHENKLSSSWPKEIVTNGNIQNGHKAEDSSSGTEGDSESDGDNEDALFGTGKKRKRKKRPSDDVNNRMKPPSSDEYSDEELAIEMKKKRKEEEEKKKAAAAKAKMLREQELEAKLIAEENWKSCPKTSPYKFGNGTKCCKVSHKYNHHEETCRSTSVDCNPKKETERCYSHPSSHSIPERLPSKT